MKDLRLLFFVFHYRRLLQNPSYYGLEGIDDSNINVFLTGIVEKALQTLAESSCVEFDEDDRGLISTTFGRIASYYYLSHLTVQHFKDNLGSSLTIEELLGVKFHLKIVKKYTL